MRKIFKFLDLEDPDSWDEVLSSKIANKNTAKHDSMFPETESALRDFFQVK
mgnify:CR=1 FL=1